MKRGRKWMGSFGRGRVRILGLIVAVAVLGGMPTVAEAVGPAQQESKTTASLDALESAPLKKKRIDEPVVDPATAPGSARSRAKRSFDKEEADVVETKTNERTYRTPEGSFVKQVAAGQKWFEDRAGAWQEVDLGLVASEDGRFKPKASPFELRVGAKGTDALAELPIDGGGSVALLVDGMAPASESKRSTKSERSGVDFDGAAPGGLSVRVEPLTTGFESLYTLSSAAQASQEIRETLRVPEGWRGRQAGRGVELVNKAGDVVARWGNGQAYDSAAVPSRVPVISQLVDSSPGEIKLLETVDAAWLNDSARVYPIVIDPPLTLNTGQNFAGDWWTVSSDPSASGDTAMELFVGNWGIDAAQNPINYRTVMQFAPGLFRKTLPSPSRNSSSGT